MHKTKHLQKQSRTDVAPLLEVVIVSPQGLHSVCHFLSWYVPSGHALQALPSIFCPAVQLPVT